MKRFKKGWFWGLFATAVFLGSLCIANFSLQKQSPGIPKANAQDYGFASYIGSLGAAGYTFPGDLMFTGAAGYAVPQDVIFNVGSLSCGAMYPGSIALQPGDVMFGLGTHPGGILFPVPTNGGVSPHYYDLLWMYSNDVDL